MRLYSSLAAAVFVAACSSASTPPGGTCATRASAELSALQTAIGVAETNIARGFSVQRILSEDGTQVEEVQTPIDVDDETEKLASLQAQLGPVQAKTNTAIAQCSGR